MPNWCYTYYNIHGPEAELTALREGIKKAMSKKDKAVEFDQWLGYLLMDALGISVDEICEGDYYCRGEITEMYDDGPNDMTIITSTAWVPAHDGILAARKKYAPNCGIIYQAEEPGNGLYETNDPDVEDYYLDIWNPDGLPADIVNVGYPYITEDDLREVLQAALKTKEKNIEKLIDEAEWRYGDNMAVQKVNFAEFD